VQTHNKGVNNMASTNVTVRIDENIKRDFDIFCENVGINITTAFNMFIKATLRIRELPFSVTDAEPQSSARKELLEAFKTAQAQSVINGTDKMTMEEINAEIALYRKEKREMSAS
jgi:DNA-damage-inducible protein J